MSWFASGVGLVVALPLYLLASFGLIANSTLTAVTTSYVFRLLAALAGVIGLISAVVGLVTGWEQFALLVKKQAPWLPWL